MIEFDSKNGEISWGDGEIDGDGFGANKELDKDLAAIETEGDAAEEIE